MENNKAEKITNKLSAKKKTSGFAIASFICGCLFILGIFVTLAAVILGIIALVKISKNQDTLKGKKLAIAGIVLGAIWTILIPLIIVLPSVTGRSEAAKIAVAKADITANIDLALKLYELDNENFPTTGQDLGALVNKPVSAYSWNGPYLKIMPKDPWGNDYHYVCPGIHNQDSYDLSSYGPDGVESEDDIVNWE